MIDFLALFCIVWGTMMLTGIFSAATRPFGKLSSIGLVVGTFCFTVGLVTILI